MFAVHESNPLSLLMAVAFDEEMANAAIKAVQRDILWKSMIIMDQVREVAVNLVLFIRRVVQGENT